MALLRPRCMLDVKVVDGRMGGPVDSAGPPSCEELHVAEGGEKAAWRGTLLADGRARPWRPWVIHHASNDRGTKKAPYDLLCGMKRVQERLTAGETDCPIHACLVCLETP